MLRYREALGSFPKYKVATEGLIAWRADVTIRSRSRPVGPGLEQHGRFKHWRIKGLARRPRAESTLGVAMVAATFWSSERNSEAFLYQVRGAPPWSVAPCASRSR